MKIISWNINGLNSAIQNGALLSLQAENADIICLQETKVSEKTLKGDLNALESYHRYWNQAEQKGYSGVMALTKHEPLAVQYGMGEEEYDKEGRLITLEFDRFYLVNAYIPNAGRGLPRLDFKLDYNRRFWAYLDTLKKTKGVVLCGDLNVAHKEIDLKNPAQNKKTAGFTQEERDSFSELLAKGYLDTFRVFNQDGGNYTWWSYRNDARARNIGWRLDYFVVNQELSGQVQQSDILSEVMGSDHCPVRLIIKG